MIFCCVLTKWKDAPCPPGPALLQSPLFLGDPLAEQTGKETCSQLRSGLSSLAGSFYLSFTFYLEFQGLACI